MNKLPPLSGPVDASGEPEQLRRLIEQWRLRAAQNGAIYASGIDECADELEAALAAAAVPSPPAQEPK